MGKFIQDTIGIRQVRRGEFQTLTPLSYITKGRFIKVPPGYITDGYSKPGWSKWIVSGSFGDDIRPAVLHDYLCQHRGYYVHLDGQSHQFIPLTFTQVNELFEESMLSVSFEDPIRKKGKTKHYIPFWKRTLMRVAVNFNPGRW